MKVLQINSFFSVGGPPRIMNGIYDTLVENGHECKIAAAREAIYVPEQSICIGNRRDVYINALMARVFDNDGFSARQATRKLVDEIEEYNPDVIQLHNLHGYYINIEILFYYLKTCGKPIVWTLHDCWSITGHCPHFSLVKCKKYITGCHHCALKREYPSSYFLDQSRKNWDRKKKTFSDISNMIIITPSQWLADILNESFLSCYPVKVINNGIDLKKFSIHRGNLKKLYSLQDKKIILGVAQNWSEYKGFEDCIHLSKLLDESYQIVMIGLTDEQIRALPKTILGLKRTNSIEELVEWYSSAEVFVNLSYQDTFPTVNIEAIACGTPIITYNTGGSPEAIDQSCGWVIEQGNVEEVATIIKTMGEKSKYQEAALIRSKLFDRKTKYKEYVDVYQEMIDIGKRI